MENQKLSSLKASEYHRIMASLLEIMEKSDFQVKADVALQESSEPGIWKLILTKKMLTYPEMTNIRQTLGTAFAIEVLPKDKSNIAVSIEGSSAAFLALTEKQ